jgi:hypothetical protein
LHTATVQYLDIALVVTHRLFFFYDLLFFATGKNREKYSDNQKAKSGNALVVSMEAL